MTKTRDIINGYRAGEISDRKLAAYILSCSTSISFKSIIEYFRKQYPDARIKWSNAEIPVEYCAPVQIQLEEDKYDLVCEIFRSFENFYEINKLHFPKHPISVLWTGGREYVILDGHHRMRRFFDFTKGVEDIALTVVTTSAIDLIDNYKRQAEYIAGEIGSKLVKDLPIR